MGEFRLINWIRLHIFPSPRSNPVILANIGPITTLRHRKFIIIRGIKRLFHKYLEVPRSHFNFCPSLNSVKQFTLTTYHHLKFKTQLEAGCDVCCLCSCASVGQVCTAALVNHFDKLSSLKHSLRLRRLASMNPPQAMKTQKVDAANSISISSITKKHTSLTNTYSLLFK